MSYDWCIRATGGDNDNAAGYRVGSDAHFGNIHNNGAPLVNIGNTVDGSRTATDITEGNDSNVRLSFSGVSGEFSTCQVGMMVRILVIAGDSGTYPHGSYEVLEVDGSGNWIDISLSYEIIDSTCDAWIGGCWNVGALASKIGVVNASASDRVLLPGASTCDTSTMIDMSDWPATGIQYPVRIFAANAGDGQIYGQNDGIKATIRATAAIGAVVKVNADIDYAMWFNVIFDANDTATYAFDLASSAARYFGFYGCQFTQATSHGFNADSISIFFVDCEFDNNGGDGVWFDFYNYMVINCSAHNNIGSGFNGESASELRYKNCISYENGVDGFRRSATAGSLYDNCVAYDNGAYGFELDNSSWAVVINCSSAENTTSDWFLDTDVDNASNRECFLLFAGNHTRTSGSASCNIIASDAEWVAKVLPKAYFSGESSEANVYGVMNFNAVLTGNFTIDSDSDLFENGYPQRNIGEGDPDSFASYPNIGVHTPQGGDYPAVGDVESGVSYGNSTYTGTFVVPLETQVEETVEYGAAAEFTGTFEGGGGGDSKWNGRARSKW